MLRVIAMPTRSAQRPKLEPIGIGNNSFSKFKRRYVHIRTIFSAKFSNISVYHDKHLNKNVVVKENNSSENYHMIINEINCLKRLNHSNIITMLDKYIDEDCQTAIIVLEYIENDDLFDFRQKNPHSFTETVIGIFIEELSKTIKYCHSQGVCHRDIKLENIMVVSCSGKIKFKLIDFGLSIFTDTKEFKMNQQCGSPNYIPPEILLTQKDYYYNEKCDIWNIGVVAYCLFYNMVPFWGKTDAMIKYNILQSDIIFKDDVRHVSDEMKDLISQFLCKKPFYRISIDDALKHPAISY